MFQGKIKHIHFVGIGGSGMSGIAEVLVNLGFVVTGSDMQESTVVQHLRDAGAMIYIGHAPENIDGAQVLVTSTAISKSNIEVATAIERHIPIIPRAEMLAELMRMKYGLAVAGTHGKTTTTSMLAMCLHAGKLDPTIIIGGKLDAIGSSAKLGHGEYLVAEADESDGSFMLLYPTIAVVTNIDPEHLDYWKTTEKLHEGFVRFINKVPFFGCAVLCADHPTIQKLLPQVQRKVITYGLSSDADVRATHITQKETETSFVVLYKNETLGMISISMPGLHNVSNALAAISVALELNISFGDIQRGLHLFQGVNRRFSIRHVGYLPAKTNSASTETDLPVTIIDDYAHHPVEIEATLAGARTSWPQRRIISIFQPHRYTRVRDLWQDFSNCFSNSDIVVVCPIYKAGEQPIEGIDEKFLAQHIHKPVGSVFSGTSLDEVFGIVRDQLQANDVVITLGAGNVNSLCARLGELLHD